MNIRPIDPAIFEIALGLSAEQARADALQAERAAVLQRMPGFVPRFWHTHAELPEDPRRSRESGVIDPWAEPTFMASIPPTFLEGLFSRSARLNYIASVRSGRFYWIR